ncbi:unnamed protein product [Parnassius apollo]|uniref:(apollo) hypothetical protein n=1 Tax=Parnassius apollo TaxID=110799 RepID=A0A8S3Y2B0_PARAO|nr:unnamed protein product [Parnassius apollo]
MATFKNKTAYLILFLCVIQLVELASVQRKVRDVEDSDTNLSATNVEAGDNSTVNNIGQFIQDVTKETSIKIQ